MMRSLNEIVMRKWLQVLYCIWICRQGSAKYAENPAAEVKEAKAVRDQLPSRLLQVVVFHTSW